MHVRLAQMCVYMIWTYFVWFNFHGGGGEGQASKNPNIPYLSTMADDAITQGYIGGLESPFQYLWLNLDLTAN